MENKIIQENKWLNFLPERIFRKRKPRFATIGSGFIFPVHLAAIKEVGELVEYDTDEDYVSILTPNDTHFEYCLKESEKGKIVICEKPLA